MLIFNSVSFSHFTLAIKELKDRKKFNSRKSLASIPILPSELLVQIFFYLNQSDLQVNMQVCHEWQAIILSYYSNSSSE